MKANIQNKRAIILTGTIIPNSVHTSHIDPLSRLDDYMTALQFYCEALSHDDIYFIENSEFDLSSHKQFTELQSKNHFKVIRYPKSTEYNKGKGYQEFEMVQKAVEDLRKQYNFFIKITGRYRITNIQKLIKNLYSGYYIDLRKYWKISEVYLLAFDIDAFERCIKDAYKTVYDEAGIYIESILYAKIKESNYKTRLFPSTPVLAGVSGSNSIILKRNPVRKFVRNLERKLNRILGENEFFY